MRAPLGMPHSGISAPRTSPCVSRRTGHSHRSNHFSSTRATGLSRDSCSCAHRGRATRSPPSLTIPRSWKSALPCHPKGGKRSSTACVSSRCRQRSWQSGLDSSRATPRKPAPHLPWCAMLLRYSLSCSRAATPSWPAVWQAPAATSAATGSPMRSFRRCALRAMTSVKAILSTLQRPSHILHAHCLRM